MKNRKFLTKILTVLLSTAIVFSGTGMQTMAAASTDGDVTAVDVLATEEVSENSIEKEAEEAKEIPAQTVAEDETGLNLEGATAADYGLEIPTGDGFKTYTVNKGDRVTLSSTATANPGVELVYSWSGNYNSGNSMDFTGYRQSSYTGTFVKNATVTCTATVKNTDISVSQTYYINIDAHFKVNGKKASSFGNGIKLAMGATTVLNPGVLSADSDAMPFTYSWTKCEYTSLNDYTASPTLVEGATASTLTTDPLTTPKCVYQLTVTDKYGNRYWGSFTIQADSGLTGGSDTGDEPVLLTYDQSYTMTSTARVNSGQTLTYKWEYYDGTTTTTLYGENTATLIRNITHSGTYTCTATDVYGYSVQDYFYVAVNAGIGHNDTVHSKQVVTYGNRVNLTSAVEATDGSSVTRQWYKFNNDGDDELISGATTRYYQTPAITKTTSFVCRTFDQYGNYAYESFDCIIDTGLKLANGNTSNETIVYYTPGQTVRLVSTAYINAGKNKTYKWYKYDVMGGDKLLSETTSTYSFTYEKPKKDGFGYPEVQTIRCKVSDEYGNSTSETLIVK